MRLHPANLLKKTYASAQETRRARLAARRANTGGHPHLHIEGRPTSWMLYCLFAVLVCCANRHAPFQPAA